MEYTFVLEGTVVGPPDGLSEHLDSVMEELVALDAIDPAIDATLSSGFVQVTFTVDASTPEVGAKEGLVLVRTAIHAAGGATPDWPDEIKPEEWGIAFEEHRLRKGAFTEV